MSTTTTTTTTTTIPIQRGVYHNRINNDNMSRVSMDTTTNSASMDEMQQQVNEYDDNKPQDKNGSITPKVIKKSLKTFKHRRASSNSGETIGTNLNDETATTTSPRLSVSKLLDRFEDPQSRKKASSEPTIITTESSGGGGDDNDSKGGSDGGGSESKKDKAITKKKSKLDKKMDKEEKKERKRKESLNKRQSPKSDGFDSSGNDNIVSSNDQSHFENDDDDNDKFDTLRRNTTSLYNVVNNNKKKKKNNNNNNSNNDEYDNNYERDAIDDQYSRRESNLKHSAEVYNILSKLPNVPNTPVHQRQQQQQQQQSLNTPPTYTSHYPTQLNRRPSYPNNNIIFNDGSISSDGGSNSTALDSRRRDNEKYIDLSLRISQTQNDVNSIKKEMATMRNLYVAYRKVDAEDEINSQWCGSDTFCVYLCCCGYFWGW